MSFLKTLIGVSIFFFFFFLEAPITLDELTHTLRSMANNRTSGIDGLPCEFYKMFWQRIGPIYHNVVNEIME